MLKWNKRLGFLIDRDKTRKSTWIFHVKIWYNTLEMPTESEAVSCLCPSCGWRGELWQVSVRSMAALISMFCPHLVISKWTTNGERARLPAAGVA